MKSKEFNNEFSINRTANTPRATAKHQSEPYPIAITADSEPFNHERTYFFFDGTEVRASTGFRRVDAEYLGIDGLRIVRIDQLRSERDDALVDAQQAMLKEIRALKDEIAKFERFKQPKNRTQKYILMARE